MKFSHKRLCIFITFRLVSKLILTVLKTNLITSTGLEIINESNSRRQNGITTSIQDTNNIEQRMKFLIPDSISFTENGNGNNSGRQHVISTSKQDTKKIERRIMFLEFAKQDVFHLKPPTFLHELKNPCWYESKSKWPSSNTLHCLPYFLLIGQSKCGSTDLFSSIISHPDIVAPRGKEAQFWAWSRHCSLTSNPVYNRICSPGQPNKWMEYVNYFKSAAQVIQKQLESNIDRSKIKAVTGEGTPSTFWDNRWWWNYVPNIGDDEAPALLNSDYIHHFIPNVKILCIFRNPVDRLYSDYVFLSEDTKPANPKHFHDVVKREIFLFNSCLRDHNIRYCVYFNTWNKVNSVKGVRLHLGFYSVYAHDWLSRFPLEQFLFLRLEDYSSSKNKTMTKIFEFLDLRDVRVELKDTVLNNNSKKKEKAGIMLPETRIMLEKFYSAFNMELAELLDDEKFLWLD